MCKIKLIQGRRLCFSSHLEEDVTPHQVVTVSSLDIFAPRLLWGLKVGVVCVRERTVVVVVFGVGMGAGGGRGGGSSTEDNGSNGSSPGSIWPGWAACWCTSCGTGGWDHKPLKDPSALPPPSSSLPPPPSLSHVTSLQCTLHDDLKTQQLIDVFCRTGSESGGGSGPCSAEPTGRLVYAGFHSLQNKVKLCSHIYYLFICLVLRRITEKG